MNSILTKENSKNNFIAFIWHGIFLALASNFMDVHTIIPSMLIKAGGNAILLGILTTIMVGGSQLMQLFFAGFLSKRRHKKKQLLIGINIRVITLFLLSLMLYKSSSLSNDMIIILIFILTSIFSFSGSYAGICYTDIVGKSIIDKSRKKFFSIKQTISSVGILISAIVVRELLKTSSYPNNYVLLLSIAGILLFIATLGFWKIKETQVKIKKHDSLLHFLKHIPEEISTNSNLKNYLIIINSVGLGLSFIPFMILFAKDNFELSYTLIGNILLYKVIGMLATSLILYKLNKKFEYKKLLYFSFGLGAIIPILSLILSNNYLLYQLIFILTGVFMGAFNIAKSGILMEISNNENRVSYAGIAGAGSIIPTIFPLIAGVLISTFGYYTTFILVSAIIISSIIFIKKLNCK
ncbi:MAG: MFS transporter [Candidatus Marinimicrobia bacterium]|nr:MFS transporter [Candidatus Neomarinimicrobiota bacterium]